MSNIAKILNDTYLHNKNQNVCFLENDTGSIDSNDFINLVGLRAHDLKFTKGQKVLIASGRGFCFFVDLFAVWATGAIAIPFDPTEGEEHKLKLSTISGSDKVLDDIFPLQASNAYSINYCDIDINETSAILFTSGTTGEPKGVELSSYSLIENSKGILAKLNIKSERLLINIPFHFTSAICHFIACCLSGSTLIGIETRLMYFDFIKAVIKFNPSGIGGAPVQYRWLADYCESESDNDFDTLKFIISSGDHLPAAVIESLTSKLPSLKIYTVYGLTEVGGRFCILEPKDLGSHLGSVGKPIDNLSFSIVEPDGSEHLSNSEEGEIVITGKLLAKGYFNNLDASAKSFTDTGFRTGDIGFIDDDGFLYLKGRSDDIFKVNGKKVSGVKITQALIATGLFLDAAVISASFPIFGTVPVAFVVLEPGSKFEKGKALIKLRETLPGNHIPHDFHILDSIPRTGSGKVKRNELRLKLNQ